MTLALMMGELFDPKKISVLRVLWQKKDKQFYLREISTESKVPVATTFRIINKLVKLGLVNQIKVNKFKLYQVAQNDYIGILEPFLKGSTLAIQSFLEDVKVLGDIISIISYGQEAEDKANVLIIGEGLDNGKVKEVCYAIKEKYNFQISYLVLTKEQYEQMSGMGLYPEKRKVLFKKS